jgi:hypothetical protein
MIDAAEYYRGSLIGEVIAGLGCYLNRSSVFYSRLRAIIIFARISGRTSLLVL